MKRKHFVSTQPLFTRQFILCKKKSEKGKLDILSNGCYNACLIDGPMSLIFLCYCNEVLSFLVWIEHQNFSFHALYITEERVV